MRVLVVEDQPQIARFVKEGLEQEGHAASTVSNGAAALASARTHAFDLILLDWLLPDLDGISVCRALRAEGNSVPIIMLTAKDAVADRVSGLDGGADDYMTKPFEFEELFARMRSVTRRAAAGAAPELQVDDLLLDPAAREVTRAGTPITLTRKEFALLEHLMRRAGQVCTRAELLSHVWGYDHDPQTNVVDVYVGYLRRKVDRGFSRRLLHTLPGGGYKLEG
jgi:DNA-binding response OmpR family regulator